MTRPEHNRGQCQGSCRAGFLLRTGVLLLAIVAMLGVSAASESSQHFHSKSAGGGCALCFNAHVAAEQAGPPIGLLSIPEVHARLVPDASEGVYQLFCGNATLTRGPPSFNL
jgi:hypothetical protein